MTTATNTDIAASTGPAKKVNLPTSPVAQAFFKALDSQKLSKNDAHTSSFVRKRMTTLGWRNRHSQESQYPVRMKIVEKEEEELTFSVQQIQRGEVEHTYGTGATVWPAAMVLLKYLERHPSEVGKLVVDLGSGTGVTSVAASLLGAERVICTDGEPNVVRLARDNIRYAARQIEGGCPGVTIEAAVANGEEECDKNGPHVTYIRERPIQVQKFWWGVDNIVDEEMKEAPAPLVVLVADCVLPKLYPIAPLVQAIDELLSAKESSQALLSYEHRYYPDYDPRDKFRELCAERNLVVQLVPEEEHDPVYSVDDIEIWRVTKAPQEA